MLTSYLQTGQSQRCYGCRACEEICPKGAISMCQNSEGFLYPIVDINKCIDCSLCYTICPYDNPPTMQDPVRAYAMQYLKKNRLMKSSSGAAFPAIADYIKDKGGYISGCIFNDEIKAIHVVTKDMDIIARMSGSKYVQSDTLNVYTEIKELLERNEQVLFSGTPCQVAGLLRFLKKDYKNLITIDLICHGVPSPQLLKEYLSSTYKDKVVELKFRDKEKNGWCSQGNVKLESETKKIRFKTISPYTDSYYQYYYLKNSVSRMTCYECKFSTKKRVADFTIGDYWNIRDVLPDLNPKDGISVVLVNSQKGLEILDDISANVTLYETSVNDAVNGNGNLQKPCDMPSLRLNIYDKIKKNGYSSTAKNECHYQYVIPVLKKHIPTSLKKLILKLLHKN